MLLFWQVEDFVKVFNCEHGNLAGLLLVWLGLFLCGECALEEADQEVWLAQGEQEEPSSFGWIFGTVAGVFELHEQLFSDIVRSQVLELVANHHKVVNHDMVQKHAAQVREVVVKFFSDFSNCRVTYPRRFWVRSFFELLPHDFFLFTLHFINDHSQVLFDKVPRFSFVDTGQSLVDDFL